MIVILLSIFVENKGQFPSDILFSSFPNGILILKDGSVFINNIEMKFLNSKPKEIVGEILEITKFNYFFEKHFTNISSYKRVRIKEIYKGIDLVINGLNKGIFEFYFEIKPNADISQVQFAFNNKNYILNNNSITFYENSKVVFKINELRAFSGTNEVSVKLKEGNGFFYYEVSNYDKSKTLVIDPTAIISSDSMDVVKAIDKSNNGIYVVGWTRNPNNFCFNCQNKYNFDIGNIISTFIAKFDNNLNLMSVAIIGDSVFGNAISSKDSAVYIGGYLVKAYNFLPSFPNKIFLGNPGGIEAFVLKLSNNLDSIKNVVVLQSPGSDVINDIKVIFDNFYEIILVAGSTSNPSQFCCSNKYVYGTTGSDDAFVVSIGFSNNNFAGVISAILASPNSDIANGIFRSGYNVFVVGRTSNANNFSINPTIYGNLGMSEAFVSKLDLSLSIHFKTVILASPKNDQANNLFVENDELFVVGTTDSAQLFSTSPKYTYGYMKYTDGFLTKLDTNLSHLSTAIIAGTFVDKAFNVVKFLDNVFVSGFSFSGYSVGCNPDCDVGSLGGYTNGFIIMLNKNLDICYGVNLFGSGGEDIFDVKGLIFEPPNSFTTAGNIYSYSFTDFLDFPNVYGDTGKQDIVIIKFNSPCLSKVKEVIPSNAFKIHSNSIVFDITFPAYLGYEIYSLNGRLIELKSLGYFTKGIYKFNLNLDEGSYIIKVRIGDLVEIKKVSFLKKGGWK